MLLKIEIIIFFLTLVYILYYFVSKIVIKILKKQGEKKEKSEKREKRKETILNINRNIPKTQEVIELPKEQFSSKSNEQIRDIISRVQVNISRGYFESAQSLIIEGLSISKNNKDLNLLLADVYERENKYQNAEYIYRDLLDVYSDDVYILQRLGNIYSLRGKMDKSFECYSEALKYDKDNLEILDLLAHLSLEKKDHKACVKYSSLYLKQKPRDAEKLSLKGYCQEMLGKKGEAIKCYESVLILQPYNKDIKERLQNILG